MFLLIKSKSQLEVWQKKKNQIIALHLVWVQDEITRGNIIVCIARCRPEFLTSTFKLFLMQILPDLGPSGTSVKDITIEKDWARQTHGNTASYYQREEVKQYGRINNIPAGCSIC